jgi:hypothetical protein
MEWYFKVLAFVVVYILLWKFFFHAFVSELIANQNGGLLQAGIMNKYGLPFKKTKLLWTMYGCNILYALCWIYIVILAIVIIFKS